MEDFIIKYWVQEAFALITAGVGLACTVVCRNRKKRLEKQSKQKQEQELLRQGVIALLHDRLYQVCKTFIRRGYCSVDDRDNLEYMFKPYKALGGNGTGEELYNRCLALPYGPEGREQ